MLLMMRGVAVERPTAHGERPLTCRIQMTHRCCVLMVEKTTRLLVMYRRMDGGWWMEAGARPGRWSRASWMDGDWSRDPRP